MKGCSCSEGYHKYQGTPFIQYQENEMRPVQCLWSGDTTSTQVTNERSSVSRDTFEDPVYLNL